MGVAQERAPGAARRGRPRRADTEQVILAAARELLADGGVQSLTVEGVAARSGVAKTTIYRRWRSKDDLALAVLIDMVERMVDVPDLDDTEAELVAFLDGVIGILGTTLMGRIMQGLASDLAADPELAAAFRERVVAVRVAEVQRLVERGITRGDLRPDADYALANELLFGPIYYRLLFTGGPLSPDLGRRVVAAVLPAFAASRSRPAAAAARPSRAVGGR